jgi:hypothetical protein
MAAAARRIPDLRDIIYLDEHLDDETNRVFWSVNCLGAIGDGGWQSERYDSLPEARAAARLAAREGGGVFTLWLGGGR